MIEKIGKRRSFDTNGKNGVLSGNTAFVTMASIIVLTTNTLSAAVAPKSVYGI